MPTFGSKFTSLKVSESVLPYLDLEVDLRLPQLEAPPDGALQVLTRSQNLTLATSRSRCLERWLLDNRHSGTESRCRRNLRSMVNLKDHACIYNDSETLRLGRATARGEFVRAGTPASPGVRPAAAGGRPAGATPKAILNRRVFYDAGL